MYANPWPSQLRPLPLTQTGIRDKMDYQTQTKHNNTLVLFGHLLEVSSVQHTLDQHISAKRLTRQENAGCDMAAALKK